MRFKIKNKRNEMLLFPPTLEEKIADDNIVRLIDVFIDYLDPKDLNLIVKHKGKSDPGAPEYHLADLLKIYIVSFDDVVFSCF